MKHRTIENPIIKDKATFILTSEETDGDLTLVEFELESGGGNFPHYHKTYSEKFTVLEGKLTLSVGSSTRVLERDDSFMVSPMVKHCFNNYSESKVKFLVELRPGQPEFEKVLAIGYGLAKDGLTDSKGIPKKFSHLALLLTMSEMKLPGIFF